jgi:D-3-phosphoglycerate dehydrogenase / 2-oxoglutarate reductase
MTERLSLSKDKIRILLLEGIHQSAVNTLASSGYASVKLLPKALSGADLKEAIKGVHMIGIRSRTHLTEEVFAAADRLIAVGCFCIGTNQVDLPAATQRGIPVFNAPFSNTRSVAELSIGEIVMLMRGIFPRSTAAHTGEWIKSAANSWEVRGKTLGIVGYGNIGTQLSVLAEAMGMTVIYYDTLTKLPHGNARQVETMDELLAQSDVVSLHVPETPQTAGMFGAPQFAKMKKGSFLLNNARGTVVDIEALTAALKNEHLLGAAIDVFPKEPAANGEAFVSPLQGVPNVILSPHIGGSTAEAQERIGVEVGRKLAEYSDTGTTIGAVNFPQAQLPPRPMGTRFIHVHQNAPGILGEIIGVFSRRGINIASQYLQTEGTTGYVVVDAEGKTEDNDAILEELRALKGTIRARMLYART